MAMIEIDEAELANRTAVGERALELLRNLTTNAETKGDVERAIKRLHPEITTSEEEAERLAKPFIEKVEGIGAKLQERLDAIDAREASSAEGMARAKLETDLARARTAGGFTDDGMEKLKALMVERNIPDVDAAVALYERLNPAPAHEPSSFTPATWDIAHNAVEDTEALFKNEDLWADNKTAEVLNDLRKAA